MMTLRYTVGFMCLVYQFSDLVSPEITIGYGSTTQEPRTTPFTVAKPSSETVPQNVSTTDFTPQKEEELSKNEER